MTTTQHTPTPWHLTAGLRIDGANFHPVGQVKRYKISAMNAPVSDEADAAHIVMCVNSHDALVAALRDLLSALGPLQADIPVPVLLAARAALEAK